MNIPGFTAEAALYKSVGHYESDGAERSRGEIRGAISPCLQNTGTTRTICRDCGCIPSFFNCDCGNSKIKLKCIENGGPGKLQLSPGFAVRR
jgi:hypothetical protein